MDLANGRKVVFKVVGVLDARQTRGVYALRTVASKELQEIARVKAAADEEIARIRAEAAADVDAARAEAAASARMQCETEAQARIAMAMERTERSILGDLIDGERAEALANSVTSAPSVMLSFERWRKLGKYRLGFYWIENRSHQAYGVGSFQVLDQVGMNNHAGPNVIGDAIDPPAEGVIAIIPARTRVRGIFRLLEPEKVGTHVTFVMSEPDNKRPVTLDQIDVWDLTPLLEEPPDENVGRVTIGAAASYGAVWIPNQQPLTTDLAATSIQSLGMRLSYGMLQRLNLEAEIGYASTGEAEFGDGLVRSARLGRLLLGAAVRLATERWIPILRGGAGLQVVHYEGVGEGFDVNPLWHFGLGLDRKLGPCAIGVGASLVVQLQDQGRSLEGGVHFGCGWKP